jgi:uncharacterized protein
MPTPIKFIAEGLEFEGEFKDTPTGTLLAASLPLEGNASRWGEEYYFSVPVSAELEEDAADVLEPGELGYWPVGSALCVFWGPTPASQGDECRAASEVNRVGWVKGDFKTLARLGSQVKVRVEKA